MADVQLHLGASERDPRWLLRIDGLRSSTRFRGSAKATRCSGDTIVLARPMAIALCSLTWRLAGWILVANVTSFTISTSETIVDGLRQKLPFARTTTSRDMAPTTRTTNRRV